MPSTLLHSRTTDHFLMNSKTIAFTKEFIQSLLISTVEHFLICQALQYIPAVSAEFLWHLHLCYLQSKSINSRSFSATQIQKIENSIDLLLRSSWRDDSFVFQVMAQRRFHCFRACWPLVLFDDITYSLAPYSDHYFKVVLIVTTTFTWLGTQFQ